jgi:hypothetical protein
VIGSVGSVADAPPYSLPCVGFLSDALARCANQPASTIPAGVEPACLAAAEPKAGENEGFVTIAQDSATSTSEIAPDGAPSFGVLPRAAAAGGVDAVDMALARALVDASTAGRFDVVLQLVKELEARRLERVAVL